MNQPNFLVSPGFSALVGYQLVPAAAICASRDPCDDAQCCAGKVQPQRIHRWLSPPTTVQEFAVSQHRPSGHPHRDGAYEYEAVDASSVNENEGFLSILTPKSSKKAKATTLKQIADHFGLDSAWLLRIQQSVYEGFESVVQKLRPGTLIFLEEDAPEDEHEKAPDVKVMKPRKRPRQQAPPPPPRPGHLLPLARPIAQRSDGDSRRSEDIDGALVFSPLRRRRSAATVAGHSGTGVGPSGTALRAASCVIGKRGRPPKTSSQSDNVLRTWPTRQHRVTVSKAKSAVLELQEIRCCAVAVIR